MTFINKGIKVYSFWDLDGTVVKTCPASVRQAVFTNVAGHLLDANQINSTFNLYANSSNCLILQFLEECSRIKAHGTYENFALFLMQKRLFSDASYREYLQFVQDYQASCEEVASASVAYPDAFAVLKKLQAEGQILVMHSNWYMQEQMRKMHVNDRMDTFFEHVRTIDNSFAKSTIDGWTDTLKSVGADIDRDIIYMNGDSKTDIVPEGLGIPTILVHDGDFHLLLEPDNVALEIQKMKKKKIWIAR